LTKATNLLNLYSGVDSTKLKNNSKKDLKKEDLDELNDKRPQRRIRMNLTNLADKTPELSKSNFTYIKKD